MTDQEMKSRIRDVWEAAAPGWAKWEGQFSKGLEGVTDQLLDAAGVALGARVLDVASGAGAQTLRAAGRVGANGVVVASDISATMLDHLRQNAEQAGIKNIETAEGAAEDVAQGAGPFDAAICRLGLMLFPAPAVSAGAVCNALKPGARFAAMVVAPPDTNPFFSKSMGILLRHADKQPPAPGQPGLFALAAPGALEGVLADGGLVDVTSTIVKSAFHLPSASDALEMMQQAFGAYRAVVADLDADAQAAAWSDVLEFLKTFEGPDGFQTDFHFIIGSGARSA